MTRTEAIDHVARMLPVAIATAYPDVDGRLLQLESAVYALDQHRRHADHQRFGPDHELTLAWLAAAHSAAEGAIVHTRLRIDEALAVPAASA